MIGPAAPRSVYTLSAHNKIHISEKSTAKSVKKDVYFTHSMDDALDWIKRQNENA